MKLFRQLYNAYRDLPVSWKWVFWLLVATQVPLCYLAANRLFVEFEIDRQCYGILHVIERVRTGGLVYVPLTAEQSSLPYAPFYMWLCGMLSRVFGSPMYIARLVSVVSGLFAALGVGAMIWKATKKNLLFSFAGAALLLLTYTWGHVWMLIIQVDALHLALVIWGFYFLAPERTPKRVMFSAILISLGFLTKQTGLAYLVAGLVYLLFNDPKRWKYYVIPAVVLCGGVIGYANVMSAGEFWRQAFQDASSAPWVVERIWDEVLFPDLLGRLAIVSLFSLVFLFGDTPLNLKHFTRIEFVLAGSGVVVALIAQPKHGSGMAQALVAYSGLMVCGMIGLYMISQRTKEPLLPVVALVLQALILFLPLIGRYRMYMVDGLDHTRYAQIGSYFERGRTCLLYYPYIPTLFGQPEMGQFGEERSMWKDHRLDFSRKPDHVNQPFRDQVFDYVIVGQYAMKEDPTVQAIRYNYEMVEILPEHPLGDGGDNLRSAHVVCRRREVPVLAE